MMAVTLQQIPVVSEGGTRNAAVNFQELLDSGELLTGTPTVVEQTTSDLTISNVSVSTAQLEILGDTVAIGEAVQYTFSGQLASQGSYKVRVTATTDATPAQTLVLDATFEVRG